MVPIMVGKNKSSLLFSHTINLQRLDANQPLIPLLRCIGLTRKERINIQHNCMTCDLIRKSLGWLILCSSGLVQDANYTCSWITIIILYFSLFIKSLMPILQRPFCLIQSPKLYLSLPLGGFEFISLNTCPIKTSTGRFLHQDLSCDDTVWGSFPHAN